MTSTPEKQEVEVSLNEVLVYAHEYEYFVDMLRDKLYFIDEDDRYRALVHEYAVIRVSQPNIMVFDVIYEMEDA